MSLRPCYDMSKLDNKGFGMYNLTKETEKAIWKMIWQMVKRKDMDLFQDCVLAFITRKPKPGYMDTMAARLTAKTVILDWKRSMAKRNRLRVVSDTDSSGNNTVDQVPYQPDYDPFEMAELRASYPEAAAGAEKVKRRAGRPLLYRGKPLYV